MKLSDAIKTVIFYGASKETMHRVNEIFTDGDRRYLDPEYEAIVAGFIDNNAITIDKKDVGKPSNILTNIKGPQKDMKAVAMELLKKGGYEIKGIEIGFLGGIADVIGGNEEKTIPVECGPCNIRKAIDYLEKENTELWIIKPADNGYVLYSVKRSDNWDMMIKRYQSIQFKQAKAAINQAFPGRRLPRILSHEEIANMFKVSESVPRDNMLLKCMYYLGLRNSEVRTLQIDDIDTINSTVKVVQGKGKKDRYVPIPEGFSQELKAYVKGSRGFMFVGRGREGTLSDRHIRRIVKSHACAANVRKYGEVHPHTLRHSYATHLQNSGVPLNVIQGMLGHERIETTTIYTHMGIDKAREFINQAFIKPLPRAPKDPDF